MQCSVAVVVEVVAVVVVVVVLVVVVVVYLSVCLQASKRSYSARLPQFFNLTTSKTQQFSESSSIFEFDTVKNEAILQDFLIFRS